MTDVVLRCPNCGTTQASSGECEACHGADVRFFCPNHEPGRWLDSPLCAECALREKRERTARPTPPPRQAPTPTLPPRERPRDRPRDRARERPRDRARRRELPGSFEDAWREHREPTKVDPLAELEATIGRHLESIPKVRLTAAPLLGCVGQLLKVAIFVLILLAMATCWFFGGGGIVISEAPPADLPVTAVARSPN